MALFINRRQLSFSALAFLIAGCESTANTPTRSNQTPSDLLPQPNAGYDAWLTRYFQRARSRGIQQSTIDSSRPTAGFLPGVITRDQTQFQTRRTLEDYIAIATSDERIAQGQAAMRQHDTILTAIQTRYGVPANIIAAVWGVESRFGTRRGDIPVVAATSTLAFAGRRPQLFEQQLTAALRILQRGEVTASGLTGSWAGAMGHTQFIPTSYETFAVDFNGDGKRNVWSDDPTDALASTAAYLSRNGWRSGLSWGAETGPNAPSGRTIQPQSGGPRFTVTRNFNVIKRYNNSDAYALAVGHLSDRLAGGGQLQASFPRDANGFSKSDRLALQRALARRGYDIGTIDGVIGPKTEAAIAREQSRRGLPTTGQPNIALLQSLN